MHNIRFSFLLGITAVPRKIENNFVVKVGAGGGGGGASKVHYGKCGSGECPITKATFFDLAVY